MIRVTDEPNRTKIEIPIDKSVNMDMVYTAEYFEALGLRKIETQSGGDGSKISGPFYYFTKGMEKAASFFPATKPAPEPEPEPTSEKKITDPSTITNAEMLTIYIENESNIRSVPLREILEEKRNNPKKSIFDLPISGIDYEWLKKVMVDVKIQKEMLSKLKIRYVGELDVYEIRGRYVILKKEIKREEEEEEDFVEEVIKEILGKEYIKYHQY